jgi:hypothetical protein
MKQCVSQCSLGRMPHDGCYATRTRQGIAFRFEAASLHSGSRPQKHNPSLQLSAAISSQGPLPESPHPQVPPTHVSDKPLQVATPPHLHVPGLLVSSHVSAEAPQATSPMPSCKSWSPTSFGRSRPDGMSAGPEALPINPPAWQIHLPS